MFDFALKLPILEQDDGASPIGSRVERQPVAMTTRAPIMSRGKFAPGDVGSSVVSNDPPVSVPKDEDPEAEFESMGEGASFNKGGVPTEDEPPVAPEPVRGVPNDEVKEEAKDDGPILTDDFFKPASPSASTESAPAPTGIDPRFIEMMNARDRQFQELHRSTLQMMEQLGRMQAPAQPQSAPQPARPLVEGYEDDELDQPVRTALLAARQAEERYNELQQKHEALNTQVSSFTTAREREAQERQAHVEFETRLNQAKTGIKNTLRSYPAFADPDLAEFAQAAEEEMLSLWRTRDLTNENVHQHIERISQRYRPIMEMAKKIKVSTPKAKADKAAELAAAANAAPVRRGAGLGRPISKDKSADQAKKDRLKNAGDDFRFADLSKQTRREYHKLYGNR